MSKKPARLTTVKPRLQAINPSKIKTITTSERRITGHALQRRRKEMWLADPTCKMCGRLVAYPHGFELDHIVALEHGGQDTVANLQILCVYTEITPNYRRKAGCHIEKTAAERK